jgi:hypothetical protein
MAESPAHKFGQIIGEALEAAIEPLLAEVARQHQLYLDKKGSRPARKGRKVSWVDKYGNVHDLDYVFERGGTPHKIGVPVAFIESAWRRYTKHSRNKAQEIQGAVLPLKETHYRSAPFLGVVLAGVFTQGSIDQLHSLGFSILYFPYGDVVAAFNAVGIDASFSENTADLAFAKKVRKWEALSRKKKVLLATSLVEKNRDAVDKFVGKLTLAITRQVALIRVLPLHGSIAEWTSAEEAIRFVQEYKESANSRPLIKYEITVIYTNGDKIEAHFGDRRDAIAFLEEYQGPELTPV